MFNNKLNEEVQVVRNKEKTIFKSYIQVEGINFEKTFVSVPRIDVIRMLFSLSIYKQFKVYEMDVKSNILNGQLEEELYIKY